MNGEGCGRKRFQYENHSQATDLQAEIWVRDLPNTKHVNTNALANSPLLNIFK
jgi:hypothetical protein